MHLHFFHLNNKINIKKSFPTNKLPAPWHIIFKHKFRDNKNKISAFRIITLTLSDCEINFFVSKKEWIYLFVRLADQKPNDKWFLYERSDNRKDLYFDSKSNIIWLRFFWEAFFYGRIKIKMIDSFWFLSSLFCCRKIIVRRQRNEKVLTIIKNDLIIINGNDNEWMKRILVWKHIKIEPI